MNDRDVVNSIKEKVDLVDYVSRDVTLKRSGKSLRGHCPHPDHDDHDPSFVIGYNQKGELVASCFGCGVVNMDVINYVKWINNVNFATAIEILSEGVGLSSSIIPESDFDLHQLLEDIMTFGREQLHQSNSAMTYLTETRGLSQEVIETAGLGYVADGYGLVRKLKAKGYTWKQLTSIGFITSKGYRCRFSGRVLFPVYEGGRIQAIGGRQVGGDGKYVRYMYTETPIPPVYSLADASDAEKPILLVEGLVDTLSVRTMGGQNVMGLTSASYASHKNLANWLDRPRLIYVLLHTDDAGQKALDTLVERFPGKVVPCHLPLGYLDVNEALVAGRGEAWLRNIMQHAKKAHNEQVYQAS